MTNILQPAEDPILVNGTPRTLEQIAAAFVACYQMELAYAKASEENGGSCGVQWEGLDSTREFAIEALNADEHLSIISEAKRVNGDSCD